MHNIKYLYIQTYLCYTHSADGYSHADFLEHTIERFMYYHIFPNFGLPPPQICQLQPRTPSPSLADMILEQKTSSALIVVVKNAF